MMSSATSVRDALEGYVAGEIPVERVVGVVVAEYYGARGSGLGARLKPLMEIVERAHPGVVELTGSADRPGFVVHLAERPFPKRYEAEFRQGVQALLVSGYVDLPRPAARAPRPGVITRVLRAIRRLFSA